MFKENGSFGVPDAERFALKLQATDPFNAHMTGEHIDRIYRNGVLVDERHGHNLVVTSFLRLVMCMLKGQNNFGGIQYWAVGSGSDAWDANMPLPELSATRLTSEIGRMPITPEEMTFLTPDFVETTTPTNVLQIRHLFGENDCNGPWREFGLFGGNATPSPNSGIMVNKRHHAILTKTEEMTVERIMRFTLTLT